MKQKENKKVTFYQNPFYDSLFGIINESIPSKTQKYKNINGSIYIVTSNSAKKFEDDFKTMSKNSKDEKWPYTGTLLLAISISLTKKEYYQKDIDNMLKAILDAMKGIVYKDDNQIESVFVQKLINEKPSWFVGVRQLKENERSWYFPPLLSEKPFSSS